MNAAITSVSIVINGRFKPENFLPEKLAEGKVITQKSAQSAVFIALLPAKTVQFRLDWAELMVLRNRLQITSIEAPHIRICDFVLKAIGDLAPDSSISQFGINVACHYDFESVDARNNFGRRIAPPEQWGAWGRELLASMTGEHRGTVLQGGVVNVQMKQPFVADEITGWRTVSIEPSPEIENNTGVLIQTNHHHQLASLDPEAEELDEKFSDDKATSLLLTALSSRFDKSIEDAFSIFEGVITSP